jgi:hypothetical protein
VLSFYFFCFAVLGLKVRAFSLSYSASPFCVGYFRDRVSQITCLGWLQTTILLVSASWVAGIIMLSYNWWYLKNGGSCCPWLTPVILATQEAEIRRITVESQPEANSLWAPRDLKKNMQQKTRLVEWLKQ